MTDTPGTPQDARAQKPTEARVWTHNGKTYRAHVRPFTWGQEEGALLAFYSSAPFNLKALADFFFDNIVDHEAGPTVGMRSVDRIGWDPDFAWSAARAVGVFEKAKKLGLETIMAGFRRGEGADPKDGGLRSSGNADELNSGSDGMA